jgi:hypothetical protein
VVSHSVFQASRTGKVRIIAEIKGNGVHGAYLHSIFLTEHFVVLCVWPAYYTSMGLSILWNRNLLDSIKYDASASTKWYVVDRTSGRGLVCYLNVVTRSGSADKSPFAGTNVHKSCLFLLPYGKRVGRAL